MLTDMHITLLTKQTQASLPLAIEIGVLAKLFDVLRVGRLDTRTDDIIRPRASAFWFHNDGNQGKKDQREQAPKHWSL